MNNHTNHSKQRVALASNNNHNTVSKQQPFYGKTSAVRTHVSHGQDNIITNENYVVTYKDYNAENINENKNNAQKEMDDDDAEFVSILYEIAIDSDFLNR